MSEWQKFKVGRPSTRTGWTEPDCSPFDSISHTSHVDAALSILDRGEIRPYLVFDESRLNDKRILVSWLSPNFWTVGFRYGNIRFDFDFKALIEGKRFYWVESIAYKIPACRILVTDENYDKDLDVYDPEARDGPWWYDAKRDQHYFNRNHCLEFMFESAIKLDDLLTVDFVDHHSAYCSLHRMDSKRCTELGLHASKGGALFLARAVGTGVNLVSIADLFVDEHGVPNATLQSAFDQLLMWIGRKVSFDGDLKSTDDRGMDVAQAACAAYSFHQREVARSLVSLFTSQKAMENALAKLVAEALDLDEWRDLLDA